MKRMRLLIVGSVLCASPSTVSAQPQVTTEPERLSAYVELLSGNAMVTLCCSVNLDWMVSPHVSVRVGAGAGVFTDNDTPVVSSLVMINRLIGRSGEYFELGAGIVRSNTGYVAYPDSRVGPTVTLGYRVQKGGRTFRIGLTPILPPFADRWKSGRHFIGAIGISRGVSF